MKKQSWAKSIVSNYSSLLDDVRKKRDELIDKGIVSEVVYIVKIKLRKGKKKKIKND